METMSLRKNRIYIFKGPIPYISDRCDEQQTPSPSVQMKPPRPAAKKHLDGGIRH